MMCLVAFAMLYLVCTCKSTQRQLHERAGEETIGRFTAHRGRVTAVARLPPSQGAELLVTAG